MKADNPPLVTSKTEARNNILSYNQELNSRSENCSARQALIDKMGRTQHWYACNNNNGSIAWGPSKYIGYAGVTPEMYEKRNRSGMHGARTQERLLPMATLVEQEHPTYTPLRGDLERMLEKYGKSIMVNARIYVLDDIDLQADSVQNGDAAHIDALVAAAGRLSRESLSILCRRLAELEKEQAVCTM